MTTPILVAAFGVRVNVSARLTIVLRQANRTAGMFLLVAYGVGHVLGLWRAFVLCKRPHSFLKSTQIGSLLYVLNSEHPSGGSSESY